MAPPYLAPLSIKLFLTYFGIWIVLFWSELLVLELGALRGLLALACMALALSRRRFKNILFPILTLLTLPWEIWLDAPCNPVLGQITANSAAMLVNLSGLAVDVTQMHVPTLTTGNLQLHVTPLCAGVGPLLSFSTLGVALGILFLDNPKQQKWLALITPIAGMVGNILRVAISTHAANIWLDRHPWAWDVAHDLIGYLCFAFIYALLWFFLKNLKNTESKTIPINP
jgi:exosortase